MPKGVYTRSPRTPCARCHGKLHGRDALAQDKFNKLGKQVDMVSSIDLVRLEHDRAFKKLPISGSQLLRNKYQSEPRHADKD